MNFRRIIIDSEHSIDNYRFDRPVPMMVAYTDHIIDIIISVYENGFMCRSMKFRATIKDRDLENNVMLIEQIKKQFKERRQFEVYFIDEFNRDFEDDEWETKFEIKDSAGIFTWLRDAHEQGEILKLLEL